MAWIIYPPSNLNYFVQDDCPCYQSLNNQIIKDDIYTTKNKGKHRFSETGYCELFGKNDSLKKT